MIENNGVCIYLSVVLFTSVYFSKIRRNPFSQQTFTTDADQGEHIKWQVSFISICLCNYFKTNAKQWQHIPGKATLTIARQHPS